MIKRFIYETETLVVSNDWDQVLSRLNQELSKRSIPALTGWLEEDRFQLTLRVRRLQLFMPLVKGVIEPTSKGCLIFLEYGLFPATRFFILFWSIIILFGGIVGYVHYDNLVYFVGSIAIVGFIVGVAWANFKLHLKNTRKVLLSVLSSPSA